LRAAFNSAPAPGPEKESIGRSPPIPPKWFRGERPRKIYPRSRGKTEPAALGPPVRFRNIDRIPFRYGDRRMSRKIFTVSRIRWPPGRSGNRSAEDEKKFDRPKLAGRDLNPAPSPPEPEKKQCPANSAQIPETPSPPSGHRTRLPLLAELTGFPRLLGPTNPCPIAVDVEPFSNIDPQAEYRT